MDDTAELVLTYFMLEFFSLLSLDVSWLIVGTDLFRFLATSGSRLSSLIHYPALLIFISGKGTSDTKHTFSPGVPTPQKHACLHGVSHTKRHRQKTIPN